MPVSSTIDRGNDSIDITIDTTITYTPYQTIPYLTLSIRYRPEGVRIDDASLISVIFTIADAIETMLEEEVDNSPSTEHEARAAARGNIAVWNGQVLLPVRHHQFGTEYNIDDFIELLERHYIDYSRWTLQRQFGQEEFVWVFNKQIDEVEP